MDGTTARKFGNTGRRPSLRYMNGGNTSEPRSHWQARVHRLVCASSKTRCGVQPAARQHRHSHVNHLLAFPIATVLGLVPCITNAQMTHQLDSTTLLIDVVLDSNRVNIPWDIVWGPDERLWMTDGRLITRWDPATDVLDTLLERPYGNGMGLALHPDFPNTPQVFAVFDTSEYYGWGGWYSEVLRFSYDDLLGQLTDETLLRAFLHNGEHSGGRLLFDTTGMLLITTSEYGDDIGLHGGPTLRIGPNGEIPSDNPWGDDRWTTGHRNAQGLALLPNGQPVSTELCMNGSEIDILHPGTDHGWPWWDGNDCWYPEVCDTLNAVAPAGWYPQSVSGCAFYTSAAIPEFTNRLLACGLGSNGLVATRFDPTYAAVDTSVHFAGGAFNDLDRIRDIALKPDGSFFLITNDRFDARIRWVRPETSTSISENHDHLLKLWPNPTDGPVHVPAARSATVEVVDALGRTIQLRAEHLGEQVRVDLSGEAPGLYTVRIANNGTYTLGHVVKR
jgi:glucose/arabinose dehydrogenase